MVARLLLVDVDCAARPACTSRLVGTPFRWLLLVDVDLTVSMPVVSHARSSPPHVALALARGSWRLGEA